MKKILSFIFIFFALKSANGQYLANDSLAREINVKALNLISKLEDCLKFDTSIKRDQFKSLFHLNTTKVFNDVMPENKLQQKVTPSEYLRFIETYYADTGFLDVQIVPYDISSISVEDEYAMLSIFATKYVNSVTKSSITYIDTFNLKIDVIYLFQINDCKIYDLASLEMRGKYIQVFPQYKGFLNTAAMPNDTILVSGKVFPVNKLGYAMLKNVNSNHEFLFQPYKKLVYYKTYKVPDNITLRKNKLIKEDRNALKVNFWNWMTYADFNFNVVFNGESPVQIANDTVGINIMNNGSFSNFIMLNLVRRVNENGYWSVKFGGGADVFTYTSYLLKNTNNYPAIDPDGDPYLRINTISNIIEKHNLTYLTAPFVLEKGLTFGRNSFFVNLAYYVMLNYSASYNQDADALYAGYYDYLFNLTIQENGIYDFGSYKFEIRNSPLVVDPLVMSYGFGIGYKRQITRKTYFDIAVNYRKSIGTLFLESGLNLSDNSKAINTLNKLNHQYMVNFMNLGFGLSIKL
jgi:hypothetical protein